MKPGARPSRSFRSAAAARAAAADDDRLALLLDAVDDLIFRLDATGRFVDWQGGSGHALIAPPEQFLGKHFRDVLPPPISERLERAIAEAQRTQTKQTFDYEAHFPPAAPQWYEARVKTTSAGDTLAVCRNVTDMRRAEAGLRASEQGYRNLIEMAPDAIAIFQDGRPVYLNSAAVKLVKAAAPEQLVGLALNDYLHPDDLAASVARQQAIVEGGQAFAPHEVRLRRMDGSYVAVEVCAGPCQFGGRAAIQLVARDVGERRAADDRLRKQMSFREAIIRTAAEGICVCAAVPEFPFVRFSVWNERMTQITGYTMDEINVLGWYQTMYPDAALRERAIERMERMRQGDQLIAEEWTLTRQDGEQRVVAISTSRVEADDGFEAVAALMQDVTERRRTAEAIAASENRLRAILDGEPECVKLVSRDGRLLEMNRAGLAMIEARSLKEARRRPLFEYIVPENRAAFVDLHRQVIAGESGRLQFQIEGLRGKRRWMDTHSVPLRDEAGAVEAALCITRDITPQRQAEESLRESEQRFRQLSDSAFEGLMIHERGLIVDANQAFAELFEFRSAAEVVGRSCLDVIPLTDESLAVIREQLRAPRNHVFEIRARRPDGTVRILETQGRDIVYRGRPARVAALRDVTERSERDHALRMFRTLIDYSTDAIEVIDPDSARFLDINLRGCLDLGYTRDEIVQLSVPQINPTVSVDEFRQFMQELRERRERTVESIHRRKDGTTFPVEINLKLVTLDREYLVAAVRDVTERKLAEDERRKLEQEMRHAQKLESLGMLAGGVAHDFNNLLTAVLMNASLAALKLPADSPIQSMLQEIQQTTERAAELTRQMLAYSGRGKFVVGRLPFEALVGEMRQLLQSVVSKKATFSLQLEPVTIEGDATQIRQVVMNLITNASDALGGESGQITIRTGRRYARGVDLESPYLPGAPPPGEYAFLEVSDSGCGMDEATCARIFEPFFSTKFTGRGLGLAATLGIVRGHHGTLKVTTAPGRGTTFCVLIPAVAESPADSHGSLRHVDAAATPGAIAAPEQPALRQGRGTILVVEDEPPISRLICRTLSMAGFDTVPAGDGVDALALFAGISAEIKAVVLDLTMPRMDGVETMRELRKASPDIPVLVMSGYSEHDVSRQFAGLRLSGFLQKPLNPRELVDRVCELTD